MRNWSTIAPELRSLALELIRDGEDMQQVYELCEDTFATKRWRIRLAFKELVNECASSTPVSILQTSIKKVLSMLV